MKRERRSGFTVTLPRPYYIGKYEVTQGEWTKVMGSNPSVFQGAVGGDAEASGRQRDVGRCAAVRARG